MSETENGGDEEPLPALSLKRVFRDRDNLRAMLSRYVGLALDAGQADALAASVSSALRLRRPEQINAVRSSVGDSVSDSGPSHYVDLAWRLAGNRPLLEAGTPAQPWSPSLAGLAAGPGPVQVVFTRRASRKPASGPARPGLLLRVRVLSGPACPLLVEAFWPREVLYAASRRLGFPKRGRPLSWRDGAEFYGMRFFAVFEERLATASGPGFFTVRLGSSFAAHNRSLIRRRRRVGYACPFGYHHPCHECFRGLDDCPVATHRLTFTRGYCDKCAAASLFDPEDAPGLGTCANCRVPLAVDRVT